MSNYIISSKADEDLLNITLYGLQNYGLERAQAFNETIKRQFAIIAKNPFHYQSVDNVREGYRRCVLKPYSIYYKVETDQSVLIVRILGRQDLSTLG